MTPSKKQSNGGVPRPDRYSKKKSGLVAQTLRLTVADNRVIRKAAKLERMSINTYAIRHLIAAANKTIAAHEPTA